MKNYYIQYRIGKSKYVVNFHNGVKLHKDNSLFYDIKVFKNKQKMNNFINKLHQEGYSLR